MAISIDTAQPTVEQDPVRIDTGAPITDAPVSPGFAETRSVKFQMAGINKSHDELYQDLTNGKEKDLREQAAAELSLQDTTNRTNLISQMAIAGNLRPDNIPPMPTPRDPASIIEEKYGEQYMKYFENAAAKQTKSSFDWQNSWLAGAAYEIPGAYSRAKDTGSSVIAKREFALTQAQNNQRLIDEQSLGGWALDQAKMLIPFYNEANLRGLMEKTPAVSTAGFGLGSNLYQQSRELLAMPMPQYRAKFTEIMNALNAKNPELAKIFAMSVVGQSTSDENLNNLFTLIDLSAVPGAIKGTAGLARTARLFNDTQNAARSLVKSVDGPEAGRVLQAIGAGDAGEAAVLKTTEDFMKSMKGTSNVSKEALESLTSNLKTDIAEIESGPSRRFGQEGVNRLKEQYTSSIGKTIDAVTNTMQVERIPAAVATDKVFREYINEIRNYYPGLRNNIMDIGKYYKELDNWYVDIPIGNKGDELFSHRETAESFAKLNQIDKLAKVEPVGGGFQLTIKHPIRETDDLVRNSIISTAESKEPVSLLNPLLGKYRTPEDVLSVDNMINRKVAAYAGKRFIASAKEDAAYIKTLARGSIRRQTVDILDPNTGKVVGQKRMSTGERYEDLQRVVNASRDMLDPEFPDVKNKGYFFRNPYELEKHYQQIVHRLPERDEIEAYFAFKRLVESDRIYRNLEVLKNKTRVGTETHSFYTINEGSGRVQGPTFDARKLKDFPSGDENILIVGKHLQDAKLVDLSKLGDKAEQYRQAVKQGKLNALEVYDPETRPFSNWGNVAGNNRVRYVLVDNLESKPLSYNQVPRRGGGHFEYDYDHYIKQAIIRVENINTGAPAFRHWYEGDTTVMPIQLKAMGEDVVNKLNTVRELLQKGKVDEAKAFATGKGNIGIEWKELHSWFKPSMAPDGITKVPPRLSMEEPFYVVAKDKMIIDIDKSMERRYPGSTFKDGTREGSLARQHQIQYTGQRDAFEVFTVNDVGTRHNPLYKYEPAKMVDAMVSMNRGLTRIINSSLMDDYKIFSVEHWLEKNKDLLKATDSEIRYAPFWHFNNAPNAFKPAADPQKVAQAKITHYQIQQFVGVKSDLDKLLHSTTQDLANSVYTKFGPTKASDWIASAETLSVIKDPFAFARGVAFHEKLGLFTIPQLLTQAQTFTSIFAVAGLKAASSGTIATMLHTFARINKNPEILNHLDKIATRFGWKPGEFSEARQLLENTGFSHVGGEYAGLDSALNPKIVQARGKDFLDAGTFFFREGEQASRTGGFYTAYKELRARVPTGPLSEADKRWLLNRADLLNVNMSRASSSALHTGVWSLPTQFLTYQLRTAELFFSKRLTGEEKRRLIYANAVMYGAPTAVGVSGLPLGDIIRQKALENGYLVGDKWIQSMMMEGLPSMLLSLATGKYWNVGDKLGVQGFETMKEALWGDKTVWDLAGGAAFSTLKGTWEGSSGFRNEVMQYMKEGNGKISATNIVTAFKEISSVNNTWKMLGALNAAKWYSKNEAFITGDVTPFQAVFSYLTGLTFQSASDANLFSVSNKKKEEFIKEQNAKFTKELRRALDAGDAGDRAGYEHHMGLAFSHIEIGGYPREQWSKAISLASQGNESMIERLERSFYTRDVPDSQKDVRYETYRKLLNQGKY